VIRRREGRVESAAKTRKARAWEATADQLRTLEIELKARRKAIRRAGGDPDRLPTREAVTLDAREMLRRSREPTFVPDGDAPEVLKVGDRVSVPHLDATGDVVSIRGTKVTVQLPTLRTTVKRVQVRAATVARETRTKRSGRTDPIYTYRSTAARHFGSEPKPVPPSFDGHVDLRGMRVEDAGDAVESALSEALVRDCDVVVLRHGYGSGALRAAVREHLRRLPHVRTLRPGLREEGSDAVTVVWIEP